MASLGVTWDIMGTNSGETKRTAATIADDHLRWRGRECLNLIPSENVTSTQVRELLGSDFGHRYTARDRFYFGTRYTDEIEEYARKLASLIFKSKHADVRPLSGHIANMALLFAFTQPGDSILSVYPDNGGYPGISHLGVSKRLGLTNLYYPYDEPKLNIRVEETKELIEAKKPKIVILGASMILFPHPVRELERTAHECDAILAYDGSHVMGLIAGGQFQEPFAEGADILLGSTHKSFFGPQGGILLAKSEFGEKLEDALDPSLVDNAHWNRIAALAQALEETREFGRDYALQVRRNAKALGKALNDEGVPVRCKEVGITESHQVVLSNGGYKEGGEVARQLERCNIITDCGIRLGTNEVTRWGMKEPEMARIASLIAEAKSGKKSEEAVRRDVSILRREFLDIHYCFQ